MRTLSKAAVTATVVASCLSLASADPLISRLTPPSRPVAGFGSNGAVIARFLPDQRFDLQATIQPDAAGKTISSVRFLVDGSPVATISGNVGTDVANTSFVTSGLTATLPTGTAVASARAYRNQIPGIHVLRVEALQSDGLAAVREGVFEIVNVAAPLGRRARNVIVFIGDGMGIAHRTAARIVLNGVSQGKANAPLAMDTFPGTASVMTSSLNSIVTDSSPGAACYSTGNKANNNQHGVFPDDTTANFDNPRVETMGEYMFRKYGKTLGIVTTADVFDATPAAFGSHTQARSAGTGIVDQYLNEQVDFGGLRVLMGGGRRWFLPANTAFDSGNGYNLLGSNRNAATGYTALPADVAAGWAVPVAGNGPAANIISGFQGRGFAYASNATELGAINTDRVLGLFANGNMNIALDKLAKRRNAVIGNLGGKNPISGAYVVDEYGFPNQPLLEEMTSKALETLNKNPNGFTLMVEGASIDKQAHNMDSDRWIMDTIEMDKAVKVAQDFANANPDTLVVVTADHECAGVNIIGASLLTNAQLKARALEPESAVTTENKSTRLRDQVVGAYDNAGFPQYSLAADGYPATTDPDKKLLIGYAANADRYEDWLTNPMPLQDAQSILAATPGTIDYATAPLSAYPLLANLRDNGSLANANQLGFFIPGQVSPLSTGGSGVATHTASDIPLSAYGRGASLFYGVIDNTDVYFRIMQAMIGGAK